MTIDINPCVTCAHKESRPNSNPCWKCIDFQNDEIVISAKFYKKRIITNADYIRSMSDEELAAHMVLSVENALLRFANVSLQGDALSEYIAYWRDWLKQEYL